MLAAIRHEVERRRAICRRWQADARALVAVDEREAYCEAQRRATHARMCDDRAEFHHWAEVAAEIARVGPLAEMDIEVPRMIVAEEERGGA